jgi:hypothetical protein
VRAEVAELGAVRAPGGTAQPYDAGTPLEALVEREPAGALDRRADAEAGLHFLRLLGDTGAGAYRQPYIANFPLAPPDADTDTASRRYLQIMVGRAPDGRALAAALRGGLPAQPPIATADRVAVQAAATRFLAWYDDLVEVAPAGAQSWQRERFEYRFDVATRSEGTNVVLSAPEHLGGPLDWHSFVHDTGGQLAAPSSPSEVKVATTLPGRAGYAGMPAARFWELEDSRVDFGGVDAAPTDLARMLVLDFATIFGNDWYVVPLDVKVGTLTHIRSLVVADTFGGRWLVEAASEPGWTMFEPTAIGPGAATDDRLRRLFVPPALVGGLESEPLEDVTLLRDEAANVAWAIERTVQGVAGGPVDRTEAWHEQLRRSGGAPPAAGAPIQIAPLVYRVTTDVPEHWIPLVPEEASPGATMLRVSAIERPGDDNQPVPALPKGRLLEPGTELLVPDEEVPAEGVRLTRSWQYARWGRGSAHLWASRRKRTGRGSASSGLAFDVVGAWQAARLPLAYEVIDLRVLNGALGDQPVDLDHLTLGQTVMVRWRVRNAGTERWVRVGSDGVRLGTEAARDHPGRLAAPSWLSSTRPAAPAEGAVEPGQIATFAFEIRAPSVAATFEEAFDLVASNGRWFDGPGLVLRGRAAAPAPPVNTAPPIISGRARTGQALMADPGTWSGVAPIAYTYQWQRGDAAGASRVDIPNATGMVYVVAPADVGATLAVKVTATDQRAAASATSAATAVVTLTPVAPASTAPPVISGPAQVGQTLTAMTGTWSGTAPISFAYRWRRSANGGATWLDIPNATAASYTVAASDLAWMIRVVVTATNAADSIAAVSAATPAVTQRPTNTAPPAIIGTAQVGQTLQATTGTWTGTAPITFSYQWRRGTATGGLGTAIPGAVSANYVVTTADLGSVLRVSVTATNGAGPTTTDSAPTAAVVAAPIPPKNTVAPAVSGTAAVGSVLTADPGKWDGSPAPTFGYQWQRCDASGAQCVSIAGATGTTYTPQGSGIVQAALAPIGGDDVGSTLRVIVTATNTAGSSSAASKPTATVTDSGKPPDPTM